MWWGLLDKYKLHGNSKLLKVLRSGLTEGKDNLLNTTRKWDKNAAVGAELPMQGFN